LDSGHATRRRRTISVRCARIRRGSRAEHPGHFLVKKVTTGGTFRMHHKLLYIANALVDQTIGLEETDDGLWAIYFNTVLPGTLNERDYIICG
jgi:hypothetical protein